MCVSGGEHIPRVVILLFGNLYINLLSSDYNLLGSDDNILTALLNGDEESDGDARFD